MIFIIKKIVISIIGLLLIISCIGIYYISKQEPNLDELKKIPSVKEEILEHKPEEEENIADKEKEEDSTEPATPVAEFTNIITDKIKSAFDFFFHKEINIVAIGDSLTQGVGDNKDEGGYVGILDRTINHDKKIAGLENLGKRGNRTDQLLDRLEDPDIATSISNADIVIITIGANDIMQVLKENFAKLHYLQFARERVNFEKRLNAILSTIKELNPNTHIYLLGIYNPFTQYFQEIKELDTIVNDWNRTSNFTTTEYEDTTFIPIKDIFDNTNVNLFAEDHFHPNLLGYRRIAERVLDYLTVDEGGDDEEEAITNQQ